jgi:hypothetical protein
VSCASTGGMPAASSLAMRSSTDARESNVRPKVPVDARPRRPVVESELEAVAVGDEHRAVRISGEHMLEAEPVAVERHRALDVADPEIEVAEPGNGRSLPRP